MVINVILAILVLSVIIIIHEFGHFIVAKANGVTVLEFSLGFGPKLLHFKKGETEYNLKLLPFGGACLMLGEDFMEMGSSDQDNSEELDENSAKKETEKTLENEYDMSKSFASKSVWSRIAIIAAGPIFNFLLAFILAVVIIGSIGYDPCIVDQVYDNSPATEAGLQVGDRIVEINGQNIAFEREYSFYRYYHASSTMNITYERDGQKYETVLTPEYTTSNAYKIGITISDGCVVNSVSADTPAEKAGMKQNDIILSINGEELTSGTQISEMISQTQGEDITVVVDRNGTEYTLTVTPELVESEAYYTGLVSYGERVKVSPLATIGYGFREVGYWIETVIKSLGMMFTGQVGLNDLSGPVGTVSVMSSVVEQSRTDGPFYVLLNLFNLTVMISANLGVMNLLPLPALDGGRLVFLIIEAVRGKPVKKEREGMVHFVGMVLLMLLMVYIMFKDIKGLF